VREQLPLEIAAPPTARRRSALTSFHARDESPAEALAGELKAAAQEGAISEWFEDHPGDRFTPSQVWEALYIQESREVPLTSVRRAISNMTRKGWLRKHPEDRRMGPRGARECTWGLA
jgi:hypothetical protein